MTAAPPLSQECRRCRVCAGSDLVRFLDLGETALANSFLKPGAQGGAEAKFPLDVYFCQTCGQVQLGTVVSPEVLFRDYIYVSSTSDTIPVHFADYAREVADRFLSGKSPLVVEVASNDGCLLRAFKGRDVRTLGVEPATNIARTANATGVETLNEFFSETIARKIREERGPAGAIIGNNVLAHVHDLDDFLRGFAALLKDDGVVAIEVPHLVNLVQKLEFDTIYHEHLSYFALRPLMTLFERHGMRIFDVKRVAVHGGSIRIYAKRAAAAPAASAEVRAVLAEERALGLETIDRFRALAASVERLREDLVALLRKLRAEGKRVAGYGAPAKGNTLLQYCGIDTRLLDFLVDRSPHKQGLLTPGSHIPVHAPERLLAERPDFTLLLAWNFADEILRQQQAYRDAGGRFILPVPAPKIV